MSPALALLGAALLALGLLRTRRANDASLVQVCAVCGAGGGLLGWGLA